MIHHISKKTTAFFVENNIVNAEAQEICSYGLELIISSTIGIVLILAIGILLFNWLSTITFLMCFIPLRLYTGGYHAKNYTSCNILFISFYILCEMAYKQIYLNSLFSKILSMFLMIFSFIIILIYSPIENYKKLISAEKKIQCKKMSLAIVSIECLVSFISIILNQNVFIIISLTVFLVGTTMVIEIIKRRIDNNEKNHKNY